MAALPPALLARLQKRGIIKSATEEVLAENYDSNETKDRVVDDAGAPGCPNKYNPYHMCSDYCYDHWREGMPENRLSEAYHRKRRRMLGKFPLPEGWSEVYDCGIGRHYYWNPDTDEVCWLSPRHPLAVIGEPAPRIAKELAGSKNRELDEYLDMGVPSSREKQASDLIRNPPKAPPKKKRRNSTGDPESDSDHEAVAEMDDRKKLKRAQRKGIDPMDPAAYGEAPVGKWSSGLRAHDKTGADVTASGPLFQQRPYPAPGAILRQQQKKQQEEEDDDF